SSLSCRCHLPLSSLFPYTTLFRSKFLQPIFKAIALLFELYFFCRKFFQPNGVALLLEIKRGDFIAQAREVLAGGEGISLRFAQRDRKSTRLNSSHGSISYAVFCLK